MKVHWKIKYCKRIKNNGFVLKTIINCIATNDSKTQAVTTFYSKYDYKGQDFVPFNKLENMDILNWLFDKVERYKIESETANKCDKIQSEIDNPQFSYSIPE